ncbi:MAG: indole-3-glycerol phosphate synthase TrpC [Rhodothermales bacterium]
MTILDRIVQDTKELVAERKNVRSISHLETLPLFDRVPLPLEAVLRGEQLAVISEIKKASPSKGVIRHEFHPVEIARQYVRGGAAAISVLTEPDYFQGSIETLAAVREQVSIPLLRKDFIVDPYQLVEARAYGADAVLLIAAVLDRGRLADLLQAAGSLGLSALVEVYDLQELDRIDFDDVSILGVNNRDLRTFEVDINHSLTVFAHVPESILRVSESGLRSARQLRHLHDHGVDAVLIGETFMREDDPGQALASLRRDVERTPEV